MKNKLPCELIKDLLPSYIEQLTSDVTNELVNEHIENCGDCKGTLAAMSQKEVEDAREQEAVQEKEIDYLKKTRKRTMGIVFGSIAAAFIIFFGLVFINLFVIGDPVGEESVYCRAEVYGNALTVESTMIDSARVPSDIHFEEEEPGIINVSFKAVLSSPWNNMGAMSAEYTADAPIRQVKMNDRIIWADGEDILSLTSAVYATRHPYVGDMSANALPVTVLNMGGYFGGFSNELQTEKEPYGWHFLLAYEISAERIEVKEKAMKAYAYVLLAVVENLGEVTYEYVSEGKEGKLTVTSQEASQFAGHDIKDCYDDIVLLQNLIKKTGLDDYAFRDIDANYMIAETAPVDEIHINVVNNAEDDVFGLGMSYGVDGDRKGEQGCCRADEEYLRRGENTTFVFYPQDFELSAWDENVEAELEVTVMRSDQESYQVEKIFKVPASGGAVYTYVLSGNAEDGYVISQ